jgi:hypothetical protein
MKIENEFLYNDRYLSMELSKYKPLYKPVGWLVSCLNLMHSQGLLMYAHEMEEL